MIGLTAQGKRSGRHRTVYLRLHRRVYRNAVGLPDERLSSMRRLDGIHFSTAMYQAKRQKHLQKPLAREQARFIREHRPRAGLKKHFSLASVVYGRNGEF